MSYWIADDYASMQATFVMLLLFGFRKRIKLFTYIYVQMFYINNIVQKYLVVEHLYLFFITTFGCVLQLIKYVQKDH